MSYEPTVGVLYIERWLKAPVQMEDGSVVPRTAGTPQGGVVSPILANLFLHYAFDTWMARMFPHIPFERYADDAIRHCKSADEAQALWSALADRFVACKLVLHPEKQKSSTARMRTGAANSRTNRLTFSVSVSEPGKRGGKVISPRMASYPPPAKRR